MTLKPFVEQPTWRDLEVWAWESPEEYTRRLAKRAFDQRDQEAHQRLRDEYAYMMQRQLDGKSC